MPTASFLRNRYWVLRHGKSIPNEKGLIVSSIVCDHFFSLFTLCFICFFNGVFPGFLCDSYFLWRIFSESKFWIVLKNTFQMGRSFWPFFCCRYLRVFRQPFVWLSIVSALLFSSCFRYQQKYSVFYSLHVCDELGCSEMLILGFKSWWFYNFQLEIKGLC